MREVIAVPYDIAARTNSPKKKPRVVTQEEKDARVEALLLKKWGVRR